MDLKHLRHFVAIIETGSFLSAAETIHLSQPALTRSIQALEQSLGVTLLKRSTRGIQVTTKGEGFYRRAKLILTEAEKAINEAKDTNPVQSLNIGMAPLFAGQFLPAALNAIAQKKPDLNIRITSGLFPDMINRLTTGQIDIMVANLPFTEINSDLTVDPLLDITIAYVASAGHPLAKKENCTFDDLSNYPWAVVDEQHANDLYQYIFTSEGKTHSPITLKTNSLTLLKSMVTEPPFITLLPQHMVDLDVSENRLALLKTNQDTLKRKGGLVYRKNDIQSAALETFKDLFKQLVS